MEMKADTSHVLMSDVLRGNVPELNDETLDANEASQNAVIVVAAFHGTKDALVGILRSVLFDDDPEVDMRVNLSEALALVDEKSVKFSSFELHHGMQQVVKIVGPFFIKACRLDDISIKDQLCTLSMGLKKLTR